MRKNNTVRQLMYSSWGRNHSRNLLLPTQVWLYSHNLCHIDFFEEGSKVGSRILSKKKILSPKVEKFNKNIRNGISFRANKKNSISNHREYYIRLRNVDLQFLSNPIRKKIELGGFCDGADVDRNLRGHRKCVIESYGYGLLPDNSI